MVILKTITFHLLLSFRGIVLAISRLMATLFLTASCLLFLLDEFRSLPLTTKIMVIVIGVIFTAINWFYDYLILACSPKQIDIILAK